MLLSNSKAVQVRRSTQLLLSYPPFLKQIFLLLHSGMLPQIPSDPSPSDKSAIKVTVGSPQNPISDYPGRNKKRFSCRHFSIWNMEQTRTQRLRFGKQTNPVRRILLGCSVVGTVNHQTSLLHQNINHGTDCADAAAADDVAEGNLADGKRFNGLLAFIARPFYGSQGVIAYRTSTLGGIPKADRERSTDARLCGFSGKGEGFLTCRLS